MNLKKKKKNIKIINKIILSFTWISSNMLYTNYKLHNK